MRKMVTALGLAIGIVSAAGSNAGATEQASVMATKAGTVEIRRDRYGVPHIYSDTVYGLFYGYGYAAAKDRLFQLEMVRRASAGAASEVLGPDLVPVDEMARFETDRESLKRQLDGLQAEHRQVLEGYAAGLTRRVEEVNAQPQHLLPKEFQELGFRPQPWTALDVALTFSAGLVNRFGGPTQELENLHLFHELRKAHGPQKAWAIFAAVHWINDPTAYTTAPADEWQYRHAVEEPDNLHPVQQRLVEGAKRPIPTLGFLDLFRTMVPGQSVHDRAREMLALNGISGRGGFESESNI